jgi:NADH-quinone oxidoreductase subunit C
MTPEEIANKLKERFGEALLEVKVEGLMPFAVVDSSKIVEVCEFLRDDDDLKFDFLSCLGGRDLGEQFEVFYMLYSYNRRHSFTLKTRTPRESPHVPSVARVWRAAEWHEREAFDMFGIVFDGHPDLRRILLPPDWEGYPLRKDYVYPESYSGIKLRRDEEGWPDPGPKSK